MLSYADSVADAIVAFKVSMDERPMIRKKKRQANVVKENKEVEKNAELERNKELMKTRIIKIEGFNRVAKNDLKRTSENREKSY